MLWRMSFRLMGAGPARVGVRVVAVLYPPPLLVFQAASVPHLDLLPNNSHCSNKLTAYFITLRQPPVLKTSTANLYSHKPRYNRLVLVRSTTLGTGYTLAVWDFVSFYTWMFSRIDSKSYVTLSSFFWIKGDIKMTALWKEPQLLGPS